jgi:DNA-binding transcriptional LysR family regulator
MHNLSSLDLRLLELFDALSTQRSVSRAADVLDLPQPAVSQGLRRLRTLFADQLFVRTAGGMAPTERALALREPIAAMLAIARAAILPEPRFDPLQSTREFRIVATDFGTVSFLPHLLPELAMTAPNVRLRFAPLDAGVFDRLADGEADLALGILSNAPEAIRTQTVFADRYVCALREGHPALAPALSLEAFRSAEHAVVSARVDAGGAHESAFDEMRGDRVMLRVPSYAILPSILGRTDLIVVVPASASAVFFAGHAIRFVDLPFDAPPITVVAAWHERSEADLGLQWLRQTIGSVFANDVAHAPLAPRPD